MIILNNNIEVNNTKYFIVRNAESEDRSFVSTSGTSIASLSYALDRSTYFDDLSVAKDVCDSLNKISKVMKTDETYTIYGETLVRKEYKEENTSEEDSEA